MIQSSQSVFGRTCFCYIYVFDIYISVIRFVIRSARDPIQVLSTPYYIGCMLSNILLSFMYMAKILGRHGNFSGNPQSGSSIHCFLIKLEFRNAGFCAERKTGKYPGKNPRSKDEKQQQTQPTNDARSEILTQATLVGGECSHHCTIPPFPYKGNSIGRLFEGTCTV